MLAIFLQTLSITAPVFAMLFLGVLALAYQLDRRQLHPRRPLVFNVTMPALLFLGDPPRRPAFGAQARPADLFFDCHADLFRHRLGLGDFPLPA